ncbi:PrgI family protein, partial [Candidatus Woesebacteria bacterium]|nr:PrgI family protein [Candidatus Woesebacteria bacterium]
MEQHPIPQHISSYEFRLVGDMTLKQFFQLAGGVLTSLLFYASPLHPLIKWPLIIFFSVLGAALAFLPFEERPLEMWIVSFFKSIYSPTLYSWRKTQTTPKFFADEAATPANGQKIIAPQGEAALKNYLDTANQKTGFLKNLEDSENKFLRGLGSAFNPTQVAPQVAPVQAQVQPAPSPFVQTVNMQPKIDSTPVVQKTINIQIPTTLPTPINRPRFVVEEKTPPGWVPPKPSVQVSQVSPLLNPQQSAVSYKAQFSADAAPPNPPTIPNIIVGQVFTPQGQIVEGAIMEVRDSGGRPVRALKSNKLGHFMIVTPLSNG